MSNLKHSCPGCGQHIEYSLEHCGRQFACPNCHSIITFPPVPTSKLRLQGAVDPSAKKKSWLDFAWLKPIIAFEHWRMVGLCLVPFLIIVGLLIGANALRKSDPPDDPPKIPRAVEQPVAADEWNKMTELGQVDQAVQFRLRSTAVAKAGLLEAERARDALHHTYKGAQLDSLSYQTVTRQYAEADRLISARQHQYEVARQSFEAAFQKYQEMGGKVDYRSQLP